MCSIHLLQLLLPLLHLDFFIFVFGSIVLGDTVYHETICASQQAVQPKEVESLEQCEKDKGDNIRDPALVLLRLPVQLVRPHGSELCQQRVEDPDVQVVSEIDPDADVQGIDWPNESAFEIMKRLGDL